MSVIDESIQTYSEGNAARALGVSKITLFRARKRGAIGFHRIGARVVYTREQLLAFLRATARDPFPTKPTR